jgi:hypothetical protein
MMYDDDDAPARAEHDDYREWVLACEELDARELEAWAPTDDGLCPSGYHVAGACGCRCGFTDETTPF